jgi:uncharacterized protein YuzE
MKVFYDKEADAAYIRLSLEEPEGVIEMAEGVNLDTSRGNRVVGIEILDASKKFPIETLYSFEVEPSEAVS